MATADTLRSVIRKRVNQHPMGVAMTPYSFNSVQIQQPYEYYDRYQQCTNATLHLLCYNSVLPHEYNNPMNIHIYIV